MQSRLQFAPTAQQVTDIEMRTSHTRSQPEPLSGAQSRRRRCRPVGDTDFAALIGPRPLHPLGQSTYKGAPPKRPPPQSPLWTVKHETPHNEAPHGLGVPRCHKWLAAAMTSRGGFFGRYSHSAWRARTDRELGGRPGHLIRFPTINGFARRCRS